MSRMKEFFIYVVAILGFMALSLILEDALIGGMYNKMGTYVEPNDNGASVEIVSGSATNVNGYLNLKVTNTTSEAKDFNLKIDLYSERNLLASTQYLETGLMNAGASKTYQLNFKGKNIQNVAVSVIDELPDKTNIINIAGWEFDVTNIMGHDLSNFKILGYKLTDIFTVDNLKTAGSNAWSFSKAVISSVPWWGYAIGGSIILWNMPAGFLLGIFPF